MSRCSIERYASAAIHRAAATDRSSPGRRNACVDRVGIRCKIRYQRAVGVRYECVGSGTADYGSTFSPINKSITRGRARH
jgi:hypothetical protein